MYFPDRYRAFDLCSRPFTFDLDDQGEPRLTLFDCYPPFGFLGTSLFDVGNGDSSGFYWPIGREHEEPLICDVHHDAWFLHPCASSLEALAKLKAVCDCADTETPMFEEAQRIASILSVRLPENCGKELSPDSVDLTLDPHSPGLLFAHATAAVARNELTVAEQLARRALDVLPEYTDARFLLASILRRTRRVPEAAREMMDVLGSPTCFGHGRKECLAWSSRLADQECPELAGDPFWQRRHALTFQTGVKSNDDFLLYEEIVEEYLNRGDGIRAVRLRVLIGELMARETVSFRERYGYTPEKHRRCLRNNLRAAGLARRAAALENS